MTRVLFVTSEAFPLVKTGGLADVCGALPMALAEVGVDVRVLLPAYPGVLDALAEREDVVELHGLPGGSARVVAGRASTGLRVLALDHPALFDRPGNIYLGADRRDWPDNAIRFAALARAGAWIGTGAVPAWRPDILHAHDWQAALAPAYVTFSDGYKPVTITTVHNLAFQGVFPAEIFGALGLPDRAFALDGLEYYGNVAFLKAGLVFADHLTTVSPTYAREIQTPEQGMGMDGLLRARSRSLTGILNGIDQAAWNPGADGTLPAGYGPDDLGGKAVNRGALLERFGLDRQADGPVFCVISRLTYQKGLDLLPSLLPEIVTRGGRVIVLGSGEGALEASFRAAAATFPDRVGCVIGYDETLSHLIQAGSDAIIVPSRFEPCGLTQLYGLRYGTLPIVARTGGLADTVIDANEAALADGVATGFVFAPVEGRTLAAAIDRAFALWQQRDAWTAMVRRAMTREVGWGVPAARYAALYRSLLGDVATG